MLRSFGSLLDVNELDGLRSMGNLPYDERVKLNMDRAKSIETLCNKIKYLQDFFVFIFKSQINFRFILIKVEYKK